MKISLIASLIAVSISTTACWEVGNGEKIGSVVKLSQEGAFFTTWEGQLIRGGLNNGTGVAGGAAFNFTVENNPDLVKKVEGFMNSQQEVRVHYRTEGFAPTRSKYNHFLLDIEPLNKEINPLKIDSTTPIAVTAVPQDQVDRNNKIMTLLQTQQQLITELSSGK